jgi:site-specific DNA-methyltransferase (adenine-specific)
VKPYYQDDAVTIYHGDCRELLPDLHADLVLTDPPYGIGERWSKSAMIGKNGSSRLWGKGETWDDAPPEDDLIRLTVEAGDQAIVWGGNYFNLPPARGWLLWDKIQKFTGADAEMAWTNLDMPVRVFRMSRVEAFGNNAEVVKAHPTQKPTPLIRWCLGFTEAATVLDPFMGSGTTLRAAKDLGLKAVGIELEERYCEIAAERCAQEVLDLGVAA